MIICPTTFRLSAQFLCIPVYLLASSLLYNLALATYVPRPLPISCPGTGLCKCAQGVGWGQRRWVGSAGSVMREQPECLWSLSEQSLNAAAPISFDPEGIVYRLGTGIAPSPADLDGHAHTYTQTHMRVKPHIHTQTWAS